MKIYYLQSEYQLGKHRIINVVYERDVFSFDPSTMSPYSVLTVDEIDPANKNLCLDLARTVNRMDAVGEGKYHVNATGQLQEKVGWQEKINAI